MAIDINDYPNKIKTNLWANKNYTIFFYNFKYESRKYRGIIDYSNKVMWSKKEKVAGAENELYNIKKDKKDGVLKDTVTLDALMTKHFTLQPDTNYVKTRKSHYDRYISPICGKKKVIDLKQQHIRDAIKSQEDKGLAPRTVKQTLEVLAPALKNAIADRIIPYSPLDGIKIKLPKTKKIVSHASEELMKIHKAIYEEFEDDPFYLSLFLFAMQGRRKSEILTLRFEDINFNKNYYILRNTKNNEEQKIFLPDVIKENLSHFQEESGWVFKSQKTDTHIVDIRRATNKLQKRLGDDNFGVHYLRNVIVSAMAEQGLDSMHLSGALGHNDPNTIKKYLTMNYLKSSEMASGVIEGIVKK